MYIRAFKSLIATAGITLLLAMCSKTDTGNPFSLTGKIDVSESSQKADNLSVHLLYSTDNGATWSQFPDLHQGQTFQVIVQNDALGAQMSSDNGFTLDWSGSTPAGTGTDVGTFTLAHNTVLNVKVTGIYFCHFDPTTFLGAWKAAEGAVTSTFNGNFAGSTDNMTFTQDVTDPNKIWATNMFGDGASRTWFMIFHPSTSADTQTIDIPAQNVPVDPGTLAATTGTYNQCDGTLGRIHIEYTAFGDTFVWDYTFSR